LENKPATRYPPSPITRRRPNLGQALRPTFQSIKSEKIAHKRFSFQKKAKKKKTGSATKSAGENLRHCLGPKLLKKGKKEKSSQFNCPKPSDNCFVPTNAKKFGNPREKKKKKGRPCIPRGGENYPR